MLPHLYYKAERRISRYAHQPQSSVPGDRDVRSSVSTEPRLLLAVDMLHCAVDVALLAVPLASCGILRRVVLWGVSVPKRISGQKNNPHEKSSVAIAVLCVAFPWLPFRGLILQ
jgi:hypothetical protein